MMKHSPLLFASVILFLLGTQNVKAQQPQESLVFEIPADGRSAALGGTLMADLQGDLHAAAYNPTLLDTNQTNLIALDYVNYYSGIGLISANYAKKRKVKGMIQFGLRALNYGEFEGYDTSGNPEGTFSGSDLL